MNKSRRSFAFAVVVSMMVIGLPGKPVGAQQHQRPEEPPPIPVNTTPVGNQPGNAVFRGGTRRSAEVVDMRTRTSRTFQNDFGAMETEVFSGSIHYRTNDGWKPIDNTLVAAEGGAAYENRANGYRIRLPRMLGAAPVRVGLGSEFVAFDLEGATGRPAATKDNRATYGDALAGVDVVYEALNDSVKEELLLDSAESASSFTWRLTASPSLTAVASADGGIDFVRSDGSVAMAVPPPIIHDAAGPDLGVAPQHRFELVAEPRGDAIRLTVDEEWLSAPERTFPVTVDPTVYTNVDRDCYIDASAPDASFCSAATLKVSGGANGKKRSLVHFDLTNIPKNAEILNAKLQMWLSWWDFSTQTPVEVRRLTQSFTNNAKWNGSGTGTWTGGNFDDKDGYLKNEFSNTNDWKSWYPTRVVKDWVSKPASNHGFIVKLADESVTQGLSFESSDGSTAPMVGVTWDYGGMGELASYTTEDKKLTERRQQRVNVAGGNLLIHETDFKIKGLGMDLVFDRYYNSLVQTEAMPTDTPLGNGWTLGNAGDVGLKLFYDADPVLGKGGPPPATAARGAAFFGPSGYRLPFVKESSQGAFQRPPGLNATLRYNATSDRYILTFRQDESQYVFSGTGILVEYRSKNATDDPNDYKNKLSFYYQDATRVSSIRDSQGRVTTFAYYPSGDAAAGKLWTVTDPAGRVHSFAYSGQNLIQYTDPKNANTLYGYDASGRLNKITDAEGHITTYSYNANNYVTRITQVTDKTTTPWKEDVTTYLYGDSTATHCPSSSPKSESKHTAEVTTADVPYMTTVLDANQNAKNPIPDPMAANAPVTRYCYGENSRVRMVFDQQQRRQYLTYNSDANVTSFIDARDKEFAFSYDMGSGASNGSLIGTTGFKAAGGVSTAAATSAEYKDDSHPGFPTQTVDAQKNKTNYKYDGKGNLTCVTQGVDTSDSSTFRYLYNPDGTLARIGAPPHPSTELPCDPLSATAQQMNDTILTYFANGNLQKIDYPDPLGDVSYQYDNLSRVQKVIKGNNVEMWLTYDEVDRLTRIWYPSTGWQVTYTYDKVGNLVRRDDLVNGGNSQSTYTYDQENQPLTESHPSRNAGGATVVTTTYKYDPNGNLTEVRKNGEATTYEYNSVNLLKKLIEPDGAVTTFEHTAANQIKDIFYPNDRLHIHKEYDHGRNLELLTAKNSLGETIVDLKFSYVAGEGTSGAKDSSLLQKVTDRRNANQVVTTYEYDSLNRISRALTNEQQSSGPLRLEEHKYWYDARSNMTRSQDYFSSGPSQGTKDTYFVYNDANQLTCASAGECSSNDTWSYDKNGNSKGKTGFSMNYDVRDRMNSADRASEAYSFTAGYLDETQEERVTRGRRSHATWAEETTWLENDLLGLEREWTPNVETITYIRDNEGTVLGQKNAGSSSSTKRYYVTDHIGSVIATVNESGNLKNRYSYDPWGKMTSSGTDTVYQPWRFAGAYFDDLTGLYKMGVRYYDPSIHRFTQMDPIKGNVDDPMTLNPYIYGRCDPVNNTDPSGQIACPSWLSTAATALNPLSSIPVGFAYSAVTSFSFAFMAKIGAATAAGALAGSIGSVATLIGGAALVTDLLCT